MSQDVEPKRGGGLRLFDGVVLVAVGVAGVLVAFWVLHALVGFVWGVIKLAAVVAILAGVVYMLMGRRRD